CTQDQIDKFFVACLGDNASKASCAPFNATDLPDNRACAACLLSVPTAAKYGALIATTEIVELNIGGCIALEENLLDGSGCGGQFQAQIQCGDLSCGSNCPIGSDQASFDAFQMCVSDSADTGCNVFAKK